MKRLAISLVALSFLLGGHGIFAADASRHVVIITLDGCVPRLFQDEYAKNLQSLWQKGAYSWSAQTVMPSVTLVAHASLLTGVLPNKHGVTSNRFRSDGEGPSVPTIFELAHKAGLQTAFISGKMKMRELHKPNAASVSEFPRTQLEELGYDPKNPGDPTRQPFDTVKAVQKCFGSVRPNLCFIHFSQPDLTGHKFGWNSNEYVYALREADEQIGALLAYWKRTDYLDNTVVIVTADHGGHDDTHGTDRGEDMTIPWVAWGTGIRKGHAIETPIRIDDTAATAAFILKLRIPKDWDGRVITEIFR